MEILLRSKLFHDGQLHLQRLDLLPVGADFDFENEVTRELWIGIGVCEGSIGTHKKLVGEWIGGGDSELAGGRKVHFVRWFALAGFVERESCDGGVIEPYFAFGDAGFDGDFLGIVVVFLGGGSSRIGVFFVPNAV